MNGCCLPYCSVPGFHHPPATLAMLNFYFTFPKLLPTKSHLRIFLQDVLRYACMQNTQIYVSETNANVAKLSTDNQISKETVVLYISTYIHIRIYGSILGV